MKYLKNNRLLFHLYEIPKQIKLINNPRNHISGCLQWGSWGDWLQRGTGNFWGDGNVHLDWYGGYIHLDIYQKSSVFSLKKCSF